MADREREKELLAELSENADEANLRVLAMCEQEDTLGYVAVKVEGQELCILKLWAKGYHISQKPNMEQTFILDSLMRAAASFGEVNGASQILTAFPDFWDFFQKRGFKTDESHAFTAMETIVHYE